jgi:hypothetical protein
MSYQKNLGKSSLQKESTLDHNKGEIVYQPHKIVSDKEKSALWLNGQRFRQYSST